LKYQIRDTASAQKMRVALLRRYRLTADDKGVTDDINLANNTMLFAVNLSVDSSGNGLPDWWSRTFLSAREMAK
jgi:hypothetical protein